MSYEDYVREVKAVFDRYKYPTAYVDKCFRSDEAKSLLHEHYEGYEEHGVLDCSPIATALDLIRMQEDPQVQLSGLVDAFPDDTDEDDENGEEGR